MLKHLTIQNYALIDHLDVDLDAGLSIITGETGAGKSIVLGALALLTGQRADVKTLKNSEQKCFVEGCFEISSYPLKDFFEKENLDYDEQTIIRREILPNGKSRAFINDTPASLTQLKELGLYLVDIHSQHQTLELNTSAFQLSVIDAIAGHDELLQQYTIEYKTYKQNLEYLRELIEQEKQLKKDCDYFQFQFNELSAADLKPEEQDALEQEIKTMSNAEEIKLKLTQACTSLENSESNIISEIATVGKLIKSISTYHTNLQELYQRIESIQIELKDINSELESIQEKVVYDPQRIEYINQRLDLIYGLQHKHQANSIKELLEIKKSLEEKLNNASSLEGQISELQTKLGKQENQLKEWAHQLSQNRKKVIPSCEKKVKETLSLLGMPNSEIKISQEITEFGKLTSSGFDKITFLFSANKGSVHREIQQVASGGEMSRLMLAIKSILATSKSMPTIIFDEIDTGVSGEIADKMGRLIREMASTMQVICITHLPQIAGKAHVHYFVHKVSDKKSTSSSIKILNQAERLNEIARMLSGENLSAAALENARELMYKN